MNKDALRKAYISRQRHLADAEKAMLSEIIAGNFFESFDLSKIYFLHCFLPIEKFSEIDTRPIFGRIRRDFPAVQTLVPRVNFQTNEIDNLKYSPETETVRNAWHIDEPAHDELVATGRIDAVLTPLLCFDARGFRVGYGKGFYDKFLMKCRENCLKIGLSYFAPVAEIADVNEFDIALDYCVTPDKVWKFS